MNQVVVLPYPGRGHINPLLNLCNSLSSLINQQNRTTVFTVVVTEEWLRLLSPDTKQANIRFATIPNVLPSELNRGSDMFSFLTAVKTEMKRPFEAVLDQMEAPVDLIIADATMLWPFDVANRRNIPVAAYWPMSASVFSLMHHVYLLESHHHLYIDVSEHGKERIDYIPGLSPLTVADTPMLFHDGIGQKVKGLAPDVSDVTKRAQYILISTVYEFESEAIDALRTRIQIPIYTSGLNIPHSKIKANPSPDELVYLNWLDTKPPRTVLYVSLGSFLPVSSTQMDEIVAGLSQSRVTFLLVARGEAPRVKGMCDGKGMVVEWCNQLRVLLHSSVGGFLTHCGWNSVKESLFSGVPMLTFPLLMVDQPFNGKLIVQDWKIGLKVRKELAVVKREEIAGVIKQFMDSKSVERIEMIERAEKKRLICQESVAESGSAIEDLKAFVRDNMNK